MPIAFGPLRLIYLTFLISLMHTETPDAIWVASPQLKVDSSLNAITANPNYARYLKPVTLETIPSSAELREEFKLLDYLTFTPFHASRLMTNNEIKPLNRYSDIPAFKDSIIKLNDAEHVDPSNYIHANLVQNPNGNDLPLNFIATQGPMEHTCESFWRMIELNKPPLIIAIVEKKSLGPRCHDYWPAYDSHKTCGDYLMTEKKKAQSEFLDLTELSVENLKTKDIQHIDHIHLHSWIDKSVFGEADFEKYLDVLKLIHSMHKKFPTAPIVVHCSAGIGRTGTLISSYFLYEQWLTAKEQKKPFSFSVFGVVRHVREQRFAAVETSQQYEFLYEIIRFFSK
jgi:protein tyrosine phosphatase